MPCAWTGAGAEELDGEAGRAELAPPRVVLGEAVSRGVAAVAGDLLTAAVAVAAGRLAALSVVLPPQAARPLMRTPDSIINISLDGRLSLRGVGLLLAS